MASDKEIARVVDKEMRGETLTRNEKALADNTARYGGGPAGKASDLRAHRAGNK